MIPAVELIAIHNNPTDSVFKIRIIYSLTPGSISLLQHEILPYKNTLIEALVAGCGHF